jgi:hypothetical protein
MALVEVAVQNGYPPLEEKKPFEEPPPVIITPCDPWPRPYYLENGLRRVAPYHFTYNTYCKERWRGRELLDIFSSEFRDRPLEYYACIIYLEKRSLLTSIERCHRTRGGRSQWQAGTDTKPYNKEWRHYIPHITSTRTSRHSIPDISLT